MKKTILSMILLAAGCFSVSAQEAKTEEVFNPHWYIRGQVGLQHTLGEVKFSKLNSLNVQGAIGYQFSKLWGARLTVGGWQSKGGITRNNVDYYYKWNYVAPTLNVTFDVTNAIWGFNPKRVVDFNIFAGVGANIAWKNDEAEAVHYEILENSQIPNNVYFIADQNLDYLWEGTKVRPVGQFGATLDFNVSKRVAIGIEGSCNFLSDKYNSKKAGNADWYFNVLAGVKIALGKTTKTVPVPVVEPQVIEKIVEKVVHDTVYINNQPMQEKIRRDVFFTIRGSEVSKAEMPKVEDIVAYLNKYPNAKVLVTGYADKGTGNAKINKGYAQKRADMVANLLKTKFGISSDRIVTESKGDTVQPYDINDLNRVSICVAE